MHDLAYGLEDDARLHYSRILWKNPQYRHRLLYVWEHLILAPLLHSLVLLRVGEATSARPTLNNSSR